MRKALSTEYTHTREAQGSRQGAASPAAEDKDSGHESVHAQAVRLMERDYCKIFFDSELDLIYSSDRVA